MTETRCLRGHASVRRLFLTVALFSGGTGYAASGESEVSPTPAPAKQATPSAGAKAFDALAVRPTQFLMSVVSTGVFVMSLPFTALDPAIGAATARDNLVDIPFGDTFQRPLGDLEDTSRLAWDPFGG